MVVAYACNLSIQELEQKDLQASLGYRAGHYLTKRVKNLSFVTSCTVQRSSVVQNGSFPCSIVRGR